MSHASFLDFGSIAWDCNLWNIRHLYSFCHNWSVFVYLIVQSERNINDDLAFNYIEMNKISDWNVVIGMNSVALEQNSSEL